MLAVQGFQQCLFVDDAAASHVHYDRLSGQPGKLSFADHASGFVSQWSVDGHDICLLEQHLERLYFLNTQRFEARLRDVRIVGYDVHSECPGAACDLSTNPSESNDSQRSSL